MGIQLAIGPDNPRLGGRQLPAAVDDAADGAQRAGFVRGRAHDVDAEFGHAQGLERAVWGDVRFCPTGGITAANAAEFLALPNVVCVGGSWLTPADALARGDWAHITALAREACQLGRTLI